MARRRRRDRRGRAGLRSDQRHPGARRGPGHCRPGHGVHQLRRVREPGLRLMIPLADSMRKVDLRTVTLPVEAQQVITKDNVSISVAAVAYYRTVDPVKAIIEIEDVYSAIYEIAQTTIRNVIGRSLLDHVLSETDAINTSVQTTLEHTAASWGVLVERVELKDIQLPPSMRRAMAREAEAGARTPPREESDEARAPGNIEGRTGLRSADPDRSQGRSPHRHHPRDRSRQRDGGRTGREELDDCVPCPGHEQPRRADPLCGSGRGAFGNTEAPVEEGGGPLGAPAQGASRDVTVAAQGRDSYRLASRLGRDSPTLACAAVLHLEGS